MPSTLSQSNWLVISCVRDKADVGGIGSRQDAGTDELAVVSLYAVLQCSVTSSILSNAKHRVRDKLCQNNK